MILYRPHRGSLEDSMKLVVEIEDMRELIKEIQFGHIFIDDKKISEYTIQIEPYGYDDRIKWNTYIVTLEDFGVVGFTNGNFNEGEK